jgi:hypothetical protein
VEHICLLLLSAADVNMLDKNMNTIKKNKAVLQDSREVGLEVNADKTKCLCLTTRMQDRIMH